MKNNGLYIMEGDQLARIDFNLQYWDSSNVKACETARSQFKKIKESSPDKKYRLVLAYVNYVEISTE